MKKADTVWVRNNGTEAFRDRYDGEDFEILPLCATEMLTDCARLCLGFGDKDMDRVIRRLGWGFKKDANGRIQSARPEAIERLGTFSYHMSEREARLAGPRPPRDRSAAPAVEDDAPEASQEDSGAGPTPPAVNPLEKLARATVAG